MDNSDTYHVCVKRVTQIAAGFLALASVPILWSVFNVGIGLCCECALPFTNVVLLCVESSLLPDSLRYVTMPCGAATQRNAPHDPA